MELPLKRMSGDKVIDFYQFQSEMKIDPDEDNNLRTRTEINVQMPKPIGKKYTHLACRKLIFNRPLHWDFAIEGKCVMNDSGEVYYKPVCVGFRFQPTMVESDFITIASDEDITQYVLCNDSDDNASGGEEAALKEKLGPFPWKMYNGGHQGVIDTDGSTSRLLFYSEDASLGRVAERVEFTFRKGEIGCFVADNNKVLTKGDEQAGVIYMDRSRFVKIVLTQLLKHKNVSFPTDTTVGELIKCLAWLPYYIAAPDSETSEWRNVFHFGVKPSLEYISPLRHCSDTGEVSCAAPPPTFVFVDTTLASILGWNAFSGPVNHIRMGDSLNEETTVKIEMSTSGKQDFYILTDPHVFDMTMKYPSYKSPIEQVLITCQDLNLNAKNIPVVISQDYSGYCPSVASFTPIHTTSTSFFTDRMLVNNDTFQVGEIISCDIPEDTTTFKFYVKFKDATGRLRDLWLAPGENVTIELAFW